MSQDGSQNIALTSMSKMSSQAKYQVGDFFCNLISGINQEF